MTPPPIPPPQEFSLEFRSTPGSHAKVFFSFKPTSGSCPRSRIRFVGPHLFPTNAKPTITMNSRLCFLETLHFFYFFQSSNTMLIFESFLLKFPTRGHASCISFHVLFKPPPPPPLLTTYSLRFCQILVTLRMLVSRRGFPLLTGFSPNQMEALISTSFSLPPNE